MKQTIQGLEREFASLSENDFDLNNEDANGMERLYELTTQLVEISNPDQASELILKTIERLADSDLGSPGPLIHTLEKLPSYEFHLLKSIERKPVLLSLWALNRILNVTADLEKRAQLLALMHDSIMHPLASEAVKQEAKEFFQFQAKA